MNTFKWWRVNEYGCAVSFDDTPELRAQIDAKPRGWYGNIEGCIKFGGVIATAFKRRTVETFDAHEWLVNGVCVPTGSITETEITAEPKGKRS